MLVRVISVTAFFVATVACRTASAPTESNTLAATPAAPAEADSVPEPEEPGICIFGADVDELETASDLKRLETEERQMAPRNATGAKPKLYAVSEYLHLPTGNYYRSFATFRDQDDNGDTQGWIEKVDGGEMVAEIKDAKIVNCRTTRAKRGGLDSCLFGTTLDELDKSTKFTVTQLPDETRASKREGDDGDTAAFHVKHIENTAKGLAFRVYSSFRDEDDGGNTIGWIERDGTGEVVAEIGDSDIYRCALTATGAPARAASADAENCRFGNDLHDLEISEEFEAQLKGEISRPSRIAGDDTRPKLFAERELTHRSTGKTFLVFNTFRDEDDDGRTLGWIESAQNGEVVAEIVASSIYNCRF